MCKFCCIVVKCVADYGMAESRLNTHTQGTVMKNFQRNVLGFVTLF